MCRQTEGRPTCETCVKYWGSLRSGVVSSRLVLDAGMTAMLMQHKHCCRIPVALSSTLDPAAYSICIHRPRA